MRQLRSIPAPAEGWLALLCLTVAAYCVVYTITAMKWVDNTYILKESAAAGLIIGLGTAKIHRLPQGILHLAASLLGYWLSIWLTGSIALQAHPAQSPTRVTPPTTSKKARPGPSTGSLSNGDPTSSPTNSQLNFLLGLSLATLICSRFYLRLFHCFIVVVGGMQLGSEQGVFRQQEA